MDSDTPPERPRHGAEHEARLWFARLRAADVSGEEQQAFQRWLEATPEHARAYRDMERLWQELDTVREAALRHFVSPAPTRPWLPLALAAGIMSLALLPWLQTFFSPASAPPSIVMTQEQVVSAPLGEVLDARLADGSLVTLAPGSSLRFQQTGNRREAVLERGGALFDVAHDRERPFVVTAGGASVTVLGTVFDVQLGQARTRVTVHQGSVRVAQADNRRSVTLAPGQRGEVQEGQLGLPSRVNLADSLAWREGMLIFEGETLGDVLADLARYDATPLQLQDPELARVPVSGVFRQGALPEFLQALALTVPLDVERTAVGYRLASPRP